LYFLHIGKLQLIKKQRKVTLETKYA
jgi:hypothetical protein